MKTQLLPCPFCGHHNQELEDCIYPSGGYWFSKNNIIGYCSRSNIPKECDNLGQVWEIVCNENEGGCGAIIYGNSEQEVIDKWNRRAL